MRRHRSSFIPLVATLLAVAPAGAQEPIRYRVAVTEPGTIFYHVEADVPATGDTTLVSLPAWTPGHYTLENYARYVRDFTATDVGTGAALRWDKTDADTWRIVSGGADRIRVGFDAWADTAGLSQSLLKSDFGFLNGTNLFVFTEAGYDVPAEVTFDLPDGWRVATELADTDDPFTFRASDYHELVDNPTFVGRFGMDSVRVDDVWVRLAVYPERFHRDPAKRMALESLAAMAEYLHELFGGVPYDRYTTFVYLATEPILFFGGLEHSESHLDILPAVAFQRPQLTFGPFIYRLFSHEYFHAWNVKRIRPAELWPYDYEEEQYTPLLWVSEGITDYYAHLILVRTGIWSEQQFWSAMQESITNVGSQPAVAVEDASLSTWIEPTFLNQNYYYDKGMLLGLLLDIRIREATGGTHSLDDIMVRLYRDHYQEGEGFTTADILEYTSGYAGEETVRAFYRDYVDGFEPLPYQETLALAGVRYSADTISEPFFGVVAAPVNDSTLLVQQVEAGSEADRVGIESGDLLERVGAIQVTDQNWGNRFREAYADSIGASIEVVYRRQGRRLVANATVRSRTRHEHRVEPLPEPGQAREALRRGLVTGEPRPETDAGSDRR